MEEPRAEARVREIVPVIDTEFAKASLAKFYTLLDQFNVSLIAEGKTFSAHKIVLAANSDYFHFMFTSGLQEEQRNEVVFGDNITAIALEAIIKYFYSGTIDINEDSIEQILKAASLFNLHRVLEKCSNYFKDHVSFGNCIGIMNTIDLYSLNTIKDDVMDFINENFPEVCQKEEFLSLTIDQILEIFESDDIAVNSEDDIYNILMKWMHHDNDRQEHLVKLVKLIRLPLLSIKCLIQELKPACASSPELINLIMETYELHLLPEDERCLPPKRNRPNMKKILFVLGDNTYENSSIKIYNHDNNSWSTHMVLNSRKSACGVGVLDDNILIIGGLENNTPVKTVDCVDLKTKSSFPLSELPIESYNLQVAVMKYGNKSSVYAVGGHSRDTALNIVQKWNSSLQLWTMVATMSQKRELFGLAVIKNKLYAVGGWDAPITLDSVEVYDPAEDTWSDCSPMNVARRSMAVATLGNKLYAVGGRNHNGTLLSSAECYDPLSNRWSLICNFPRPCDGVRAVSFLKQKLIVLGGTDKSSDVYEYRLVEKKWIKISSINDNYDCAAAFAINFIE